VDLDPRIDELATVEKNNLWVVGDSKRLRQVSHHLSPRFFSLSSAIDFG
jgi:hypothetical protein